MIDQETKDKLLYMQSTTDIIYVVWDEDDRSGSSYRQVVVVTKDFIDALGSALFHIMFNGCIQHGDPFIDEAEDGIVIPYAYSVDDANEDAYIYIKPIPEAKKEK